MRLLNVLMAADYGIWGGPVLLVATVFLLLVGLGFDRKRLGWIGGGIGVGLWIVIVTGAMTLCLYAMGEAGRGGGWRLPALFAAMLPFVVAAEWSLRRVRAH